MTDGMAMERLGDLAGSALLRDRAYVNGAWVGGDPADVTDPFTGEAIGRVPLLDASAVQAAIEGAEAAFPAWSRRPNRERGALLRGWLALIERDRERLARLITLENGKPLREARGEIAYGAGFIEYYAEEARRIQGEVIPADVAGRRLTAEREPIGVCFAITPWNFPMAMLARKIAPALAAGCTIVCKPAMQTPLSALALAALAEEAGIPPGVLNVVTGEAAMIGGLATRSPVVRKISFTGSTGVGALLMQQSAPTIKRLSLELGGNAPLLVFDDADPDVAIETAMVAKFRNGGQSCIAANRIYVQRGILPAFTAALRERIAGLTLGDGLDEATDQGPLIDARATAKVDEHIGDAVRGGGQLLVGGASTAPRMAAPTLVANVARDALMTREETFGPLAALIAFDSYDEGIAMANDTPFGLAAYVCSRDPQRIARATRDVESGMVGINTGLISTASAPFGGVKQSGLGREGSHHGIAEYLNLKYVCHAGL
ncbi:MAG: NAD-dependent succinate-semialdehyde dehydrogenase [Sphingomonas fennica]